MREVPFYNGRRSALPRAAVVLLAVFLLVAGVQALAGPADDVATADEIVRGTISGVQSRWNDDHTHIVTTATVTVAAWLKGAGPSTITVSVPGGNAGGITEVTGGAPALVAGAEAYLFLQKGADLGVPADGRARSVVTVVDGRVPQGPQKGGGIPVADYDTYLAALARGESAALPDVAGPLTRAVAGPEPVIASVSPTTASAGTGTVVTITGTGFGAKSSRSSSADVGFLSRYDGSNATPIWASGAYYFDQNENDIISWTDTKIQVRVPTGITAEDRWGSASSGYVFVVNENQVSSSTYPFTVTFGYGGYKWNEPAQFYVNPGSVAGAETAIANAAATWNAAVPTSGFRLEYNGTTPLATFGNDGVNLVSFHPASAFSGGQTYGESSIWYSTETGYIVEADIRLNADLPWTTGTASGDQLNVQACALHMLGHWLSLDSLYGWYPGYPSDMGKAMFHYNGATFGNQNLKTLHGDDAAGIRWIYPPRLTVSSVSPSSGIPGATVSVSNLAGTAFEAGATVRLNRTGEEDIAATNVVVSSTSTKITCKLPLPVTAVTGPWNVTVTNPGGEIATLVGGFTVNPSVTSIVPARSAQNTTVAFTLGGAGFEPNATVKLTRTGQPEIVARDIVWISPGLLNGTLEIPLTAAIGTWTVILTNPSGSSAKRSNAFTVDPAITVNSIAPNTGVRGTNVPVVVAGIGFQPNATVRLTRTGQPDIWGQETVTVSPEQIAAEFALPLTATIGTWTVAVVNPDGSSDTLPSAFTITLPPIELISIAPTSGNAGWTVPFSIAGAEFVSGGTTVTLTRSGSSTITATSLAVISTGQINGTFVLPETAATGPWHVNVTNSGRSASLPNGFAILPPTLTVISIDPNAGVRGTSVPVNITGTGFAPGATVSLTRGSTAIYATGVDVRSPTAIACTIDLPSTATTGLWNVVVSNPGGPSGTLPNGFTINPGLAVTSISPNNGVRGATIGATVSGTGFVNGADVKLVRAGEPDITATGVVVTSATRITCTIALPGDAAIGTWDVVVTNPDGESASKDDAFTIKMPLLTVTSITPNTGLRGTTVPVTIGGTEFASGATVTLTKSGQAGIVATDVVVVSPATITCTLELPPAAASGAWNVVVTNPSPDDRSGTLANGFTITLPTITVIAIEPNTGIRGTTVPVTVTGTEFETGTTTVKLTRAGASTISATGVNVASSTQITCTLVVPATAPLGAYNVVVTNAGRSQTLPNGFTIEPPLAVLAIEPNTGVRGTTVPVAITGSRFEPGTAVSLVRIDTAEIPGTNVVVKSPTEITCAFALPALADTGAWNVVVTSPGNLSVTLPAGFAVFDRPPPPPVHDLRITTRLPTELAWFWTDPVAADFVRVQVYLNNEWQADVPNGTQYFHVSALQPGTQYTFSTRTYDSVGNPSTWVNVTTRTPAAGVIAVPGGADVPGDTGGDGLCDDVNGNGRKDFADVVLFFNQMTWIAENEPLGAFDYNGNGRIDFADVVWLFNNL